MLNDPAAMLRHLFSIPQAQIDRDLDEAERDFARLIQEPAAIQMEHRNSRDPALAAQYHHKRMVRAKVVRHKDFLADEMSLRNAEMAARGIAEEAVSVAHGQGRLAELGNRMQEIQTREGLQDLEFWPIGEGPEDYQAMSSESEELYGKVRDTVFITVLRRYHLDDMATLYENDRTAYDEISERGRRMFFERNSDS